jgi:putative ATP-binding cassette transporter
MTRPRDPGVALDRTTWKRFVDVVRDLAHSDVGGRAGALFATLLLLMLGINALNVVNSYVGRDFITAIERRSRTDFVSQALLYAGVFALSTVVAVMFRFVEERLGLLWRRWLTAQMVEHYLAGDAYLRLKERGEVANADQRIADDTRSFTTSTLSFALMLLNGTFTILAFSGVLWSISPLLFVVAIGYAGLGSAFTLTFGRPLIRLNYDQSDREASLRADLVRVHENAESIALLRREGRLGALLARRLDELVANARRIIAVNRNLSFFTIGYNYGIQLIPALVIGPQFIRGQVEFGVITQSAMAFSHLLGAFSLVVTQIQSLSSYAAVLARLNTLATGVEDASEPAASKPASLEVEGRLAYEDVTLCSKRDGSVLVERLRVEVSRGTGVLVTGPPDAQLALFRATAGLWDLGTGRIVRPPTDRIMFLPERPYLPPGTLREVLLRTKHEREVADAAIVVVLGELGLESMLARVGGLDTECDWDDVLSLPEQQLVEVARVVLASPSFAVFHSPGTTLGAEALERVVVRLRAASVGCLVFAAPSGASEVWNAVLELRSGGAWAWQPAPKQGVA